MKSIKEYWQTLPPFRRGFLVVGSILALPLLLVLCLIVGLAEVWKLIQGVDF